MHVLRLSNRAARSIASIGFTYASRISPLSLPSLKPSSVQFSLNVQSVGKCSRFISRLALFLPNESRTHACLASIVQMQSGRMVFISFVSLLSTSSSYLPS